MEFKLKSKYGHEKWLMITFLVFNILLLKK